MPQKNPFLKMSKKQWMWKNVTKDAIYNLQHFLKTIFFMSMSVASD